MSAAKKQASPSSAPIWLRCLFSWLLGAGRPVLIVAVLAGLFGGGWYYVWKKIGPRILGSPEYHISGPEQVEITPPPAWIHSDIRVEALRTLTRDGPLSLLDADLTERISKAFAQCAWVAKVARVTKQHPGSQHPVSVTVEVEYRKPACMVEVRGGVLPVDAEGVLLPSVPGVDFTPNEASRYPHLAGAEREPAGGPGQRWGDAAVVGGAEIAAALVPVWDAMKLDRIIAMKAPAGGPGRHEPTFLLVTRGDTTRGGTRISWGYATGATNAPGEVPTAEKVARLRQYWAAHDDSFDGPQGQRQELDVRTMPPSLRP